MSLSDNLTSILGRHIRQDAAQVELYQLDIGRLYTPIEIIVNKSVLNTWSGYQLSRLNDYLVVTIGRVSYI